MAENDSNRKRARVDSDESPDSPTESPDPKRFHFDLLDFVDDVDPAADDLVDDVDPAADDLATVMKILEEEIASSPSLTPATGSDSGGSQPELGYLLEASDDDLGLPPTESSTSGGDEEEDLDALRGASEAVGFGGFWGFDDDIPCYDALELGFPEEEKAEGSVVLEGLFEYSDFSDFSWRHGSVPALW